MNVQQLIDALMAIDDKRLPVQAEGCDCINPAAAVTIDGDGYVLIGIDSLG